MYAKTSKFNYNNNNNKFQTIKIKIKIVIRNNKKLHLINLIVII